MDETAQAFDHPHARASATHAGPPLDRISVRDYVREIEIGAFRSEHGVTQRLRFNVVLEVAHHAAGSDDVDRIVSYDGITEAIEAAIAAQRLNLLETLAERVAAGCLGDPRAVRVFVRIEKLDRIPGALGVEIVRSRVGPDVQRLRALSEGEAADMPAAEAAPAGAPRILILPPALAASPEWIEAAARAPGGLVTIADSAPPPSAAIGGEAGRRIGLLALDQAAWALAGRDPRFEVVASRTELDWAARSGRRPVWAPAQMLGATREGEAPAGADTRDLATWLAGQLGADTIVVAGEAPCETPDTLEHVV